MSRKPFTVQTHVPYPASRFRKRDFHAIRKKLDPNAFSELVIRNAPNPHQSVIHANPPRT
jgi:hypothetical protein